CQNYSDSPYSF
nr:immunoglobulin light chain junction region [Macaca mulatta]